MRRREGGGVFWRKCWRIKWRSLEGSDLRGGLCWGPSNEHGLVSINPAGGS